MATIALPSFPRTGPRGACTALADALFKMKDCAKNPMDEPIRSITQQPSLPPLEEVQPYLEQIWNSHQLTNCGPFHRRLEAELAKHLGINYLSLFANGTLALVTALQALGVHGEVITTPYSFVATTHALNWNRITPVFVDIDPMTLNLDPAKVEKAAITPATTAILATHVYGHPLRR